MTVSSFTKLRPSLGRIVVEPMPEEERSEVGLWLVAAPEVRDRPIHVGVVVEVCNSYKAALDDEDNLAPMGPNYKIGDIVVFGKYSGIDIKLGRGKAQKHYFIMNESEVLATLEEEDGGGES